jgi:large subunit ribosomal protein L24
MEKNFLKKGDKVKVISGKHKGKIGEIIFLDKKSFRASIDSIEKKKKLEKKQKESFFDVLIHLSNLMLIDPVTNLPSRIGVKIINNQKVKYFKRSGNLLESSNKKELI